MNEYFLKLLPRSPAAPRRFLAILGVDVAAPPVTVTVTVDEAVCVTVTAAHVPEPPAIVVEAAVVLVGLVLEEAPVVDAGTSLSGTYS